MQMHLLLAKATLIFYDLRHRQKDFCAALDLPANVEDVCKYSKAGMCH